MGQNGTKWYRLQKIFVSGHQESRLSALNLAKCPLLNGKNGTGLEKLGRHEKELFPFCPGRFHPGTAPLITVLRQLPIRHAVSTALEPKAIALSGRRDDCKFPRIVILNRAKNVNLKTWAERVVNLTAKLTLPTIKSRKIRNFQSCFAEHRRRVSPFKLQINFGA